jgi:hypothetical protein
MATDSTPPALRTMTAERLAEIEHMEWPKGRTPIVIAELLDALEAQAAEVARLRIDQETWNDMRNRVEEYERENRALLSRCERMTTREQQLEQAFRDALDALTLPMPTYRSVQAGVIGGVDVTYVQIADWTARRDLVARTLREGLASPKGE